MRHFLFGGNKMYPPHLPVASSRRVRRLLKGISWWLTSLCVFVLAAGLFNNGFRRAAAAAAVQSSSTSPDGLWTFLSVSTPPNQRQVMLNFGALVSLMGPAIQESKQPLSDSNLIMTLPTPEGTFMRFRIVESSVLEPGLASALPEIKSYRAQGVDDPSAYARLSRTPRGFHALVLLKDKTITVQPVNAGDPLTYVTYYGQNIVSSADFQCLAAQLPVPQGTAFASGSESEESTDATRQYFSSVGGALRNYRIAIATTYEYTSNANLGGGSVSNALASLNTWLNAVNAIYERDLSIRLTLAASNSNVIYTTASDPFTNGDTTAMLTQVRTVLRDVIGTTNFDVGHVLGTGNSGLAYIGVACNSSDAGDNKGPLKAGGVSLIDPNAMVGDTFFLTRIAHELAHQFGANHSFNDTDYYSGSRVASKAYESGTGVTIMSYAGGGSAIVAPGARAPHFHGGSLAEAISYVTSSAPPFSSTATGNTPPTVNAGADYTIPRNTPFMLTATASDPDAGDAANLSYAWEQMDAGGTSYGQGSYSDASDPSTTTRPIFRPYEPSASPARVFPKLNYILSNANVPPATVYDQGYTVNAGESLPNVTRTLNFRVTVRDQRGGVSDDGMVVNVSGAAGPFAVTAPNTAVSWAGGSTQTVSWSVANTNAAPVSVANVKITLSTDGGQTFPITLAASTPNDGTEAVLLPTGLSSTQARVKVEALNNIFFDISNTNFTLSSGVTCNYTLSPTSQYFAPSGGAGGFSVTNTTGCTWNAVSNVAWITITSGTGNGSGTVSFNAAANPGAARSGTLTVGGVNHTVNQTASTCTYNVSPTSANIGANGGPGSVSITPKKGCGWSAWSNVPWITISGGTSGTGSGTVNYSVAANSGAARTGTLKVGGVTVTITQSCSATISSTSQPFAPSGGTGTISVATSSTCAWTATSNASWLTITSGASGSGNGVVNYSVAANSGAARTGTLTVAGNTFTVTQATALPTVASLSPTSAKVNSGAFVLTVNGTNFNSSSVVRWNGSNRVTTYVSPTQLRASILTTDVSARGTASVTVYNSGPVAGLSNSLSFSITR
jgi:hypothetical protein